jgi:phage shock protein E
MHHAMKALLITLALLLGGQALWLATASGGKPVLGDIAAATQAWGMIADGALVVDVRSAEEYSEGHIDGAINIPHTQVDRIAELIGDDLARPVVVYCRSGNRSGQAEAALKKRGYTGVFNGTGLEALQATQP